MGPPIEDRNILQLAILVYQKLFGNSQRCRQNSWRATLFPLHPPKINGWNPWTPGTPQKGGGSSFGKWKPFQVPFVSFWECKKVFLKDQKIRELIVAPDLSPSLLSSCNASISHSKFISTFPHHFPVIKTASVCRIIPYILWHTHFADGTHASFTFIVHIN